MANLGLCLRDFSGWIANVLYIFSLVVLAVCILEATKRGKWSVAGWNYLSVGWDFPGRMRTQRTHRAFQLDKSISWMFLEHGFCKSL